MSEHDEQVAVVDYCAWSKVPVFAIPNGGLRSKTTAAKLKAEGVSPGVPDLFVPVARGRYHGLFIEMKFGKNRPTEAQRGWLSLLGRNGYAAICCHGSSEAIDAIDAYMRL